MYEKVVNELEPKMIKNFEIICPECGNGYSYLYIGEGPKGSGKRAICKKCKAITLDEFIPNENYVEPKEAKPTKPNVTCPFCNSTDCKKISGASKVGKVLMWGVLAAGSVGKTWHCNSCGSNFG